MSSYLPPLREIDFVLNEIVDLPELLDSPLFEGVDADSIQLVLEEIGRFMSEVVAPTNRDGDQIGAVHQDDGSVTTPDLSLIHI